MQDAGWWYPPCQDWSNWLPPHLCALAAADQDIPPQPVDATFEDAQLIKITGHTMVLVITQNNLPEPCTDRGRTIMLPALELSLDCFELRHHPLLRRDPPDGEGSLPVALPTEMGEAQEGEGLWFSLSTQAAGRVWGLRLRRTEQKLAISLPLMLPSAESKASAS